MPTPQQDWFYRRRWGVFVHYLDQLQNADGNYHNTRRCRTDWEDCVGDFDTALFARQLHEANAGYVIFTLCQGTQYLCAPSTVFNTLTGYAPGEACSRRDLVEDLYRDLSRYDIPLFLYFTGDGPHLDPRAMSALYGRVPNLGGGDRVHLDFVRKWSAVLREYAERYGGRVRGWWVDGLYVPFGYDDESLLAPYRTAVKKGNPDALFSANYYGCVHNEHTLPIPGTGSVLFGDFYHSVMPPTPYCDYTAGEVVTLDVFPTGRLLNGAQTHILSFLGIPRHPVEVYNGWGARGCKYSIDYLMQYIRQVNTCGGVVSLDVCLFRDGHIDPDQMRVLKMLGNVRRMSL